VAAETDLELLVLTPEGMGELLDNVTGLAKSLLSEVAGRLVSAVPDHSLGPRQHPHMTRHHSELSDPQLIRLSEVLRRLGATESFSASEALSAALNAEVVNNSADIGSAIDDLEDAGLLKQVQSNPPRWKAVEANEPDQTGRS